MFVIQIITILDNHTLLDCPKSVPPSTQPKQSVTDGFQTVSNKNKGRNGGTSIPGKGGFNKPGVGPKFRYQPKAPPNPKQVDNSKMKATEVASMSETTIATSNPFDALNVIDTHECGTPTDIVDSGCSMEAKEVGAVKTGNVSQEPLVSDSMEANEVDHTPIFEKIGELEKLLMDEKATLVDDAGNPIKKVDYPGKKDISSNSSIKRVNPFSKVGEIVVSDSDDEEVVNTFDESSNLFGGGHDREDDFDDYGYDNYADQVYDLPGNLDAYYDTYGIKLQGLGRK